MEALNPEIDWSPTSLSLHLPRIKNDFTENYTPLKYNCTQLVIELSLELFVVPSILFIELYYYLP